MPSFKHHSRPWDHAVEEPLLPSKHSTPHHPSQQQPAGRSGRQTANCQQDDKDPSKQQTVDLGSRFLRRLWRIMCIVNATPALSLVLLSLAETVIVSKIGTISGLFYQVFVDGEASRVPQLMLWSAGCYTATALFYSFKSALQDFFAWRWRASLTLQLQRVYCSNVGTICARSQAPLLQSLDSPDQRVAQDLPLLTASLSEVLTQLAAVPFNIVWYTHLTRQVFDSWVPVWCAYLFFLMGLVLQRLVMLPVAAAVFQQEAAEGAFRYGYTRFRAWAAEIAMYRSAPLEQGHLETQLSRVLICQGRLMLRRAVVTATSRLLDYGGLVVNFGCLAAAVFGGAWSGPGQSAGDLASKVSIASFYLLTLVYNFSQILDLASKVANLAGLTARVSQMLELLPPQQQHHQQGTPPGSSTQQDQHRTHSRDNNSREWKSSQKASCSSSSRKAVGHGPRQGFDHQDEHYQQDVSTSRRHHQQEQQHPSPRQQQLQEVAAGRSPSHQRYASQAVLLQAPQLMLLPAQSGVGTPLHGSSRIAEATSTEQIGGFKAEQPHRAETATLYHKQQQQVEQQLHQQQQQQQQHEDRGEKESGEQQQVVPAVTPANSSSSSQPSGLSQGPGRHKGRAPGTTPPDVMQVSIHSMGADMLLQEVRRAFPDSPRLAPLLAVVTFQFCGTARDCMLQKLQQQMQSSQTGQKQGRHAQHQQGLQMPLLLRGTQQEQQEQRQPSYTMTSSGGSSSSSSMGGGGVIAQQSCCSPCAAGSDGGEGVGDGASSSRNSSSWVGLCADADMQHMLVVFLNWQQMVYDHITNSGYWCDTIDPRTGTALHSTPGTPYDEVIGASVLLGYDQVTPMGQAFTLISHPDAATQVYPATLFTSAPLPVLREALRAAAATQDTGTTAAVAAYADNSNSSNTVMTVLPALPSTKLLLQQWQQQQQPHSNQPPPLPLQQGGQQQPQQQHRQQQLLLSCTGLSLSTPSGVLVVKDLRLQVSAGSSLLIQGPSGCGKSTLVSCLAGLWPLQAGSISILGRLEGQGSNLDFPSAAGGAAGGCALGGIIDGGSAAGGGAGGAGAAGGVMFVPQRPLAAPGVTMRQQLLYPAAESMWPCSCTCSSSSSRAGGGAHAQHGMASGRQQRGQQRQQRQRQWGISHSWWLNWLSCGLHKQHQQQQQRQQQQFVHAVAPAMRTTTSSSCPPSLASQKQLQQQQLSPPLLPPPQPLWQQQQQQQSPGSQQQQQQLPVPQQQLGLGGLCPSCQHLASILHCVGLGYLLAAHPLGLHSRHEAWGDVLSPGELQRIAFVRVLLHRPALAVLDEATSALPAAAAVELYRQLVGAGVSFVSVGHSSCLVGVHDRVLSVAGDGCGGWQLS